MVIQDRIAALRHRVQAHGVARTASYVLFTVIGERAGLELNATFLLGSDCDVRSREDQSFALVGQLSAFTERDLEVLSEYGGAPLIERFTRALEEGETCVLGRAGAELAAICWLIPRAEVPDGVQGLKGDAIGTNAVSVERCFTLPDYRGQGFFPNALNFLRGELPALGNPAVFIEASIFNDASVRGITKSGFEHVGTKLNWRGRRAFVASAPAKTRGPARLWPRLAAAGIAYVSSAGAKRDR